jgi:hypothetical protein
MLMENTCKVETKDGNYSYQFMPFLIDLLFLSNTECQSTENVEKGKKRRLKNSRERRKRNNKAYWTKRRQYKKKRESALPLLEDSEDEKGNQNHHIIKIFQCQSLKLRNFYVNFLIPTAAVKSPQPKRKTAEGKATLTGIQVTNTDEVNELSESFSDISLD